MKIPKMDEVFLIEGPTDSPQFKAWFKNSKVVDETGQPLVVYHSTDARADFNAFKTFDDKEIGFHFGTVEAAEDRLDAKVDMYANTGNYPDYKPGPGEEDLSNYGKVMRDTGTPYTPNSRIMPVYLSIQNPLNLPDLGTWEPEDIVNQLWRKDEWLTKPEYDWILSKPGKREKNVALKVIFKKHNIDGIKYKNSVEHVGSISWIAFEPQQVKSIFNKGSWNPNKADIREDDE